MTRNWRSEKYRQSVRFIEEFDLHSGSRWGFVVLRPTDAAENEAQWTAAIAKIRACVALSFNFKRIKEAERGVELDPAPDELASQTFDLFEMELPCELGQSADIDSGALASARSRFSEWSIRRRQEEEDNEGDIEQLSTEVCILLNAVSVKKLASDMPPNDCHIIIFDEDERGIVPNFYSGWMWAEASELPRLFLLLHGVSMSKSMREICPKPEFEGQLPLFNGGIGYGVLINPPGGVGARLSGTRRGRGP